jgi:Insertion element 4 transposase N-terminal
MYYVIAQAWFMQVSQRAVLRCLLAGVRWLSGAQVPLQVTGKSGLAQARRRLGWAPVKQLHDAVVALIAVRQTRGAWYQNWKLVSLAGSRLDVADTNEF